MNDGKRQGFMGFHELDAERDTNRLITFKDRNPMTLRSLLYLAAIGAVLIALYWGIKLFW
ncbi:hypothetical protein [Mesorhizobium sp. B263B2A]|uniref:hypothetical protein n=1 Tax=Mesorhizobium sp. B263B2A TaxID=2876669 RepID=UPI001CD12FDE|nr:hypothetical protein [Mesorhizobium sp. B263B2A]MCA0032781.1 hypothetical protein [Mesorhizobium sp. B263B2A]